MASPNGDHGYGECRCLSHHQWRNVAEHLVDLAMRARTGEQIDRDVEVAELHHTLSRGYRMKHVREPLTNEIKVYGT